MDSEIRTLKIKITEYESKIEKPKEKNELFCQLYSSFSQKKLVSLKIDMIIGIYLYRYKKEMEIKYNKMQKKIDDLTEELYMFKFGKKIISDLDEIQNENIAQNEGENSNKVQIYEKSGGKGFKTSMTNRSTSQGITRVINVGTVTKEIGNALITTKTTQISYKKKMENIEQK